jgi:DNA helicase HerA-like ATPase
MADLLIAAGEAPCLLHLATANRHGLIAGATGTGKTITLQVMAEAFSAAGVPVFCADVKGDLAGLAQPGRPTPKLEARAARLGATDFRYQPAPVVFWDVFGRQGHPVRATVAEMGPLLLARMLELNETQEGVLAIAFALADDEGLLLLDFKDLRAMLAHVAARAGELGAEYGNVSKATVGTIQRKLLQLEQQGAEHFFGEPALELSDLMLMAPNGHGAVNILAADALIRSPRLYATFLLWLLSELFEKLPEVGDLDKPKLVFFFDEAHLLFRDAPRALVEKVEQVVRLIRSKGVGVYFVTQNPADLPEAVLGQLGNRVQHALRAFTPADQKAVRAAAETFRPNPRLDVSQAIGELEVGEALVSLLDGNGIPGMVQRAKVLPPRSRMGAITEAERRDAIGHSPVGGRYDAVLDRESAYETLSGRVATVAAPAPRMVETRADNPWGAPAPSMSDRPAGDRPLGDPWGQRATAPPPRYRAAPVQRQEPGMLAALWGGTGRRQGLGEAMAKSMVRGIGSQVGRAVVRGLLGSILRR